MFFVKIKVFYKFGISSTVLLLYLYLVQHLLASYAQNRWSLLNLHTFVLLNLPTTLPGVQIFINSLPIKFSCCPVLKGSVCHPYLSLSYYDILEDVNIRSFVIGASNVLFKQKRHNIDVLVEVRAYIWFVYNINKEYNSLPVISRVMCVL